jgi:hypothetical protein
MVHENQVDGLGIFVAVSGADDYSGDGFLNGDVNVRYRDNLAEVMRKPGYMAIMKDTSTAFIFTGGTWTDSSNWSAINSDSGLPGQGDIDDVLTKKSSSAYDSEWSNTINISALTVKNHGANPPECELIFSRYKNYTETPVDLILGIIKADGFSAAGKALPASAIKFIAGGDNSATGASSNIQFFTSTQSGPRKAFEMSEDRTLVFSGNSSAPTAEVGAVYYNTITDSFYVGGN